MLSSHPQPESFGAFHPHCPCPLPKHLSCLSNRMFTLTMSKRSKVLVSWQHSNVTGGTHTTHGFIGLIHAFIPAVIPTVIHSSIIRNYQKLSESLTIIHLIYYNLTRLNRNRETPIDPFVAGGTHNIVVHPTDPCSHTCYHVLSVVPRPLEHRPHPP